jgi:hypothetical protein
MLTVFTADLNTSCVSFNFFLLFLALNIPSIATTWFDSACWWNEIAYRQTINTFSRGPCITSYRTPSILDRIHVSRVGDISGSWRPAVEKYRRVNNGPPSLYRLTSHWLRVNPESVICYSKVTPPIPSQWQQIDRSILWCAENGQEHWWPFNWHS